jgi:AcrR family transcriptional regulator
MSPRRAGAVAGRAGDPSVVLRDHLLDTAERLLAVAEVGTITARDVATGAGVSTGVLYNYFGDKNELLLAALARRFARLVSSFRAELAKSQFRDAAQGACALAELLYQLNREALPLFGKLLAEPALLRRFVVEIHDAAHPFGGRQIRDAVVAFLASEPFAAVDAEAAADVLLGGVGLQALTDLLAGLGEGEVDRKLRRSVELILGGLAPDQSRRTR